jgi:hypothetical protein
MKNLLTVVFFLLVIQGAQSQAPFYMLFDSTCMDVMQFKLSSSGAAVFAYGIHAGNQEQYMIRTGPATTPLADLPKGTTTCGKHILGEEFLQAVNFKLRPVFLLIPDASGYNVLPLTAATQFKRSGSLILVKSDKYDFALDTSSLSMEKNLATKASKTKVYFRNVQKVLCQERFSYRLEPVLKSEAENAADIEYIPGIGITKIRYTTPENKQEVQTLELINGETVGVHLGKMCKAMSEKQKNDTDKKPADASPPKSNN